MNFHQVSEKIDTSDSLDFGRVFSASIELFKKVWVQGFIVVLLTFVVLIPFYLIAYIPMMAAGMMDPYYFESEELSASMILFFVVFYPIMVIGVTTFSTCLSAAFLRICKMADMDQTVKDDYFFYFKKPYLGKAFVLALIVTGLSIVGMLACGLGLIYLAVPMSLFVAFFAFDRELTPMEITKASFALGNKNWLIIFGLLIVAGLVAQLGVILCFIGVLFTAMFGRVPIYFIYKNTVGFPSEA
ncbi:hypothetical protein [Flagellimonas sp.]|uniref:hypothetical protein n=1 Tax=Flagellimonas sp. TaxID=2058762 RepID=UPI003F4A1B1B